MILALCLAMTGCDSLNHFIETHPKTSAVATTLILGSLALTHADGSGPSKAGDGVGLPPAPCAPDPERCR
jgi:hypothetical protein